MVRCELVDSAHLGMRTVRELVVARDVDALPMGLRRTEVVRVRLDQRIGGPGSKTAHWFNGKRSVSQASMTPTFEYCEGFSADRRAVSGKRADTGHLV